MGKGGGHVAHGGGSVCGEGAHVSCGVCCRGTPQVVGPRRLVRARSQLALGARMSRHQRPSHEDEHAVAVCRPCGSASGSAELVIPLAAPADIVELTAAF